MLHHAPGRDSATKNAIPTSTPSGRLYRVTGESDVSQNDDVWAMEMLSRIKRGAQEARERRDALAAAVDEVADGFTQLGLKPWKMEHASSAREDMTAPDVLLGGRAEPAGKILRYEAAVNILSAADQLRGFAVLLRAEASLMGAVSVARGVFEACLWATAVIDPTITTDERLQRALTRRLARLSAGIRLSEMLGGGVTDADQVIDNEGQIDDEHGTYRDPAKDIADIESYAKGRGWPLKKRPRATEITRLSIDWLSENLERRIGIEGYAWTSGSSMAHGEHAADTASWIELSQDIGTAPAWLIRLWSPGAWVGPRLFLATLASYTGVYNLRGEYRRLEELFLSEQGKG
ncbi:hypothetical protein OG739_36280 [Streptomyces longwoodensis]|uniref:hypothetical protein n=1 Tax=Streptomyces longwoodensis TaxID=68231 RepID=UPI0022577B64|nr:hypothetical protein [Streptomyces longwoodensis]MCX5000750.1 hypothetical protein [Streptomyces longwoodensis]